MLSFSVSDASNRLNETEKYLLLESDVGEGMFFAGLKHVAIKVIASYTENQIITSKPSEVLQIKKEKAELAAQKEEEMDKLKKVL